MGVEMKVLVIGGGGREHAIIKKLKESKEISKLYALPGNGGMASDAECVGGDAKDIAGIVAFAKENKIDYAVVAPDDPLVLGAMTWRRRAWPASVPVQMPLSSREARCFPRIL